MVISLGTVALWCGNSALDKYLGQMGIVAIIPMVFFFGFGLLNKVSTMLCHLLLLGPGRAVVANPWDCQALQLARSFAGMRCCESQRCGVM